MRRTALAIVIVSFACLSTGVNFAEESEAERSIRSTVLDYVEGWYTGDPERIEQAVHPDLAKRIIVNDNGRNRLQSMSALGLMQRVRTGWGTRTPEAQRVADIEIFDVNGDTASVKLIARDWVDYMHLGRVDGRWVIINVLWSQNAPERTAEAR